MWGRGPLAVWGEAGVWAGSRPRAEETGGHHRVWVGVRVRVRVRVRAEEAGGHHRVWRVITR